MENTIGSREVFALEYEFITDPDDGKQALPEEALSWGHLSIWVNGLNLCHSSYKGEFTDHISWYLYPVLLWFAQNWNPLMYEEQPPAPTEKKVARSIFFEYAKQSFGIMDEKLDTAWYNWGQRHSLRACSNGGIFPDVFIRSFGDSIEFSWGNPADNPGVPSEFFFTAPFDVALVERKQVIDVLETFLKKSASHLLDQLPLSNKLQKLNKLVLDNTAYTREKHLKWMIPGIRDNKFEKSFIRDKLATFFNQLAPNYVPAPILMYGSSSPTIQESDIDLVVESIKNIDNNHPLESFVKNVSIPSKDPYESGYDLALDFVEVFYEDYQTEADIEIVLKKLEISVLEMEFSDPDMRGIAMAGKNIAPTIFINKSHPNNFTENGTRFSIAHEFCHLLFDRKYGQEVGISSGPWAPPGVEKRANAFAAMLLMPIEAIESKKYYLDSGVNLGNVKAMADEFRVSCTALIEHLYNVQAITLPQRDKLRQDNQDCSR